MKLTVKELVLAGAALISSVSSASIECVFHRGLHCFGLPENTVESIRAAYESGARWVETDFNAEPDGTILCYHDPGKRKAVVPPYRVPTLEEILAIVPEDGVLQSEIKTYAPSYPDRFERAVIGSGLTEKNIRVSSFDYTALADFKRRLPKYYAIWLIDLAKEKGSVEEIIDKAKRANVQAVCPWSDATIGRWSAKDADMIRAAGLDVRVYGANSPRSLQQCAQLGALGFTCNFPHEAFRWAREKGIALNAPRGIGVPAVFRVSGPAAPGERVLLSGGNWGTDPRVAVEGGGVVIPDLISASELVFRLPKSVEGAVMCKVISEQGASALFGVNFPEGWWLFGDEFDYSTPGGVLRVFGRSLEGASCRLVGGAGETIALTRLDGDMWQAAFTVPASAGCGAFSVEVCTPLSKDWRKLGDWSVGAPRKVRGAEMFDVTDFGAVANDAVDDSAAVSAALAAAEKNGGGTVLFPRGRFKVKGTIAVPAGTMLKGVSRELSCIYWPDTATPPTDLVTLRERTGICGLMLSSGQPRSGITGYDAKGRLGHIEDVLLEDLTLRFVSDQQRDPSRRAGVTNFLHRYRMLGTAVKIPCSKRVRLRGVDVYTDRDATASLHFNIGGEWIDISRSKFRGTGYSMLDGGPFIFERNEGLGTTFSLRHDSNRMYFGKNAMRLKYAGDREAITLDGGRNAFHSRLAVKKGLREKSYYLAPGSAQGTRVTLTPPPPEEIDPSYAQTPQSWVGRHLRILTGRGAGQTRTIVSAEGWSSFEVDRPFDVAPDSTSRFELSFERKNILMVDNVMEDVGLAQLYGGATQVIIAGNVANRAGGFEGYGLIGRLPCWSVSFIGNRIMDGNNLRGPHDPKGPHDAIIGSQVISGPFDVPMNRAFLIRGNVIESNARIVLGGVHGAVVEGNEISDSDFGIVGGRYPNTCWIGQNSFTGVSQIYKGLERSVFGGGSEMLSADFRAALWLKSGEGTVVSSGGVWRVATDVRRSLVKIFREDGTKGKNDLGDFPLYPEDAVLCGDIQRVSGHLQGVATDGTNLYWSSTRRLVKTDGEGNVLVARDAESHHGDLCFAGGVVYVAVNLGKFNTDDEAKSFVWAYRASDLERIGVWPVPELVHGAGGMTVKDGRFFVVGGLPFGRTENYIYEYDASFKLIKRHSFATGYTRLGIQTADWDDARKCFVLGCYALHGKWSSNILVPGTMDGFSWERPGCPLGHLSFRGRRYMAQNAKLPDGGLQPFIVPLR